MYLVHKKKIKTVMSQVLRFIWLSELDARYYFAIHILVINVDTYEWYYYTALGQLFNNKG